MTPRSGRPPKQNPASFHIYVCTCGCRFSAQVLGPCPEADNSAVELHFVTPEPRPSP